jgi:hypothetical protein
LSNAPDLKKWNAQYQWYPFADANVTAPDNPIIVDSGEGVMTKTEKNTLMVKQHFGMSMLGMAARRSLRR